MGRFRVFLPGEESHMSSGLHIAFSLRVVEQAARSILWTYVAKQECLETEYHQAFPDLTAPIADVDRTLGACEFHELVDEPPSTITRFVV